MDPKSEEIELAGIRALRTSGGDRDVLPGWRRVTLYVAGEEFGMWFVGDDIDEVNETVKAWLGRGDDDQDEDDDLSTRVASFPQGDYLFTFRRSWVAGYRISISPQEKARYNG